MSDIAARIDRALIRALVQRQIFCPRTGQVLDVRTCVVLRDQDGDPMVALSQEGWQEISEESREALAEKGLTVDVDTVETDSNSS